MAQRSYSGDPIDAGYQHITERPSLEDEADDVVYATEPEPQGQETTAGVPELGDDDPERPVVKGQTTIGEWRKLDQ